MFKNGIFFQSQQKVKKKIVKNIRNMSKSQISENPNREAKGYPGPLKSIWIQWSEMVKPNSWDNVYLL